MRGQEEGLGHSCLLASDDHWTVVVQSLSLLGKLDCSQQPEGPRVRGHSIIPGGHFCCWLLSQAPNASIKVLPEDS